MKREDGRDRREKGEGITLEERDRERERAGSVEVNLCLNRETDRGDNRKTFGSLSKDYPARKERGKERHLRWSFALSVRPIHDPSIKGERQISEWLPLPPLRHAFTEGAASSFT